MGEGAVAAMLDGLPKAGTTIAGKYVIERVLAVGGMGAVMAAHDEALDRRIAIKFLLPKALENADVRARFFREARAAVAIRSEHVVDVYEVGVAPPDVPFIVMEYLPGRDLHKLLDGRAPLPVTEAVDYVLQACEALAEAHSLGIVHRDVKPSNLFVTHRPDGTAFVKVLDFGISKTTGAAFGYDSQSKSLTQSSVALGSPLYMSPEQVRNSKVVDARTDIWSIGIVLYELLAKQLPFDGETVPSLAAAIASDAPRPLRPLRPDIPPKLEAVIMRCLEKDPSKRYPKISSLARDLLEFAGTGQRAALFERIEQRHDVSPLAFESTSERASPLSEQETQDAMNASQFRSVGAATTAGLGTTTQRKNDRRTRSVWIVGLVSAAVASAGGFVFMRQGQQHDEVAPSTAVLLPPSASAVPDRAPPLPSAAPSAVVANVANVATPSPSPSPAVATPPPAHATTKPTTGAPKKASPKTQPATPAVRVTTPPPPPPPHPPDHGGLPSALDGAR